MTNQTVAPTDTTATNAADFAGDLQMLSELATVLASARDAMSDEIVTRLSKTVSEGIVLLDRLTRNEGLMRLLRVLERPQSQNLLMGLGSAITAMSREVQTAAPARGGVGGLLQLVREPGTQEAIRMLSLVGQHLSHSLREKK